MTGDFLKDILEHKRRLLDAKKVFLSNVQEKLEKETYQRYKVFKQKISQPGQMNLIAEIKKASPSKGILREDFDITAIAKIYTENGAAAMSILTEEKYFLGRPDYIKKIMDTVQVPILMKDFFIKKEQIFEARYLGASAVLLIAAILEDSKLKELYDVASALDLDCLVEVHNEQECERALDCGVEIIGINNRDLQTFEIDMKICEQLIPKIPKDKIIVAESGIHSHEDIKMLQALGAHAVLIGETFMKARDMGSKMKDVMHGQG